MAENGGRVTVGGTAGARTLVDGALAAQEQSLELARAVTLGTLDAARVQAETAIGLTRALLETGAGLYAGLPPAARYPGDAAGYDEEPPIEGYDELTMEEIEERLGELSAEETVRLRDYEKGHKNRPALLELFDRSLV